MGSKAVGSKMGKVDDGGERGAKGGRGPLRGMAEAPIVRK